MLGEHACGFELFSPPDDLLLSGRLEWTLKWKIIIIIIIIKKRKRLKRKTKTKLKNPKS